MKNISRLGIPDGHGQNMNVWQPCKLLTCSISSCNSLITCWFSHFQHNIKIGLTLPVLCNVKKLVSTTELNCLTSGQLHDLWLVNNIFSIYQNFIAYIQRWSLVALRLENGNNRKCPAQNLPFCWYSNFLVSHNLTTHGICLMGFSKHPQCLISPSIRFCGDWNPWCTAL